MGRILNSNGSSFETLLNNNFLMKTSFLSLIIFLNLLSFSAFSQTENPEPLLGLPGDNLDLYAVLDLFQKSKTIEDFEKSLNDEKTGINNLDLNNDEKVDFIKVVTEKEGDNFLFILQDPINEKETQDVAVISVAKDQAGKVSLQIIGDQELYGQDYIVEPATKTSPGVTANPAYVGNDPVTVNVAPTTEVIVVEAAPIVQYVYSPVYVPYYPPYYYGYYPPYYAAVRITAAAIYHNNHYHYHHGYNNTVVINNHNHYNNYNNNSRKTSNTVNNNIKNGNFNTAGRGSTRPSTSQAGRTSNAASTTNRPTASQSGRTSNNAAASKRSSNSPSAATSNRSSRSNSSASRSMGSSRSMSTGRSMGGRRR
jgi:hypothetical protein